MFSMLKKLAWFVVLGSCCLTVPSCRKSGSQMNENWTGGLITKDGVYKVASSKQTITVWIDKEHLVRYLITDIAGKTLIASTERPSAYSGWFIVFDGKGWLWFESSDIGCSVARKNADGTYQEFPI